MDVGLLCRLVSLITQVINNRASHVVLPSRERYRHIILDDVGLAYRAQETICLVTFFFRDSCVDKVSDTNLVPIHSQTIDAHLFHEHRNVILIHFSFLELQILDVLFSFFNLTLDIK